MDDQLPTTILLTLKSETNHVSGALVLAARFQEVTYVNLWTI